MNEYMKEQALQHAGFDKDAYNRKYYDKNKAWKQRYNHEYYLKNKSKWWLGSSMHGVNRNDAYKKDAQFPTRKGTGVTATRNNPNQKAENYKKPLAEKTGDILISLIPGMGHLYKGSSKEFVNSMKRSIGKITKTAKAVSDWWNQSIDFNKMMTKFDEIDKKYTEAENKVKEKKQKVKDTVSKVRKIFNF